MTLRMLKPYVPYQRSGLRLIEHRAPDQIVARLQGGALRAVRRRLLARSGGLCECPDCRAGYPLKLTWQTMEADHIVPLYQGGTNAFDNHRALHVDCHARVTAQQQAERATMGRAWVDDTLPMRADLTPLRRRQDDDEMLC